MRKNLLLAIIGRVVSELGSSLFRFGLSLYILDLTGSAVAYSSFLIFSILPGLFVNVFAGAIIDRASKKKILVLSDIISGIAVFIFMLVFQANQQEINLFLVYAVILSLIQAFFMLSMNASVPELVPEEHINKANSAFQSVGAFISILGPVLGAIVYTNLGLINIFIIDGVSFLIAGILESLLTYRKEKCETSKEHKTNMIEDVKEVFRYLGSERGMIILMMVSVAINFFFVPMLSLVLPFVCYQVIGVNELQLSLIQGSWAAGMIIGALLVSRLKDNRPLLNRLFQLLVLTGILIMFWIFPAIPVFAGMNRWFIIIIYIINLLVSAVINSYINIPIMSFIQVTVPESLRGRFFGVLMTASMLATPLGLWAFGLLLEHVNWIWAPVISGVAVAICAMLSAKSQNVKRMFGAYQVESIKGLQCESVPIMAEE